jgi:hypothetical protein
MISGRIKAIHLEQDPITGPGGPKQPMPVLEVIIDSHVKTSLLNEEIVILTQSELEIIIKKVSSLKNELSSLNFELSFRKENNCL